MIHIIKPGLLTSVQDLGRFGFQRYGVISSGAMDLYAHRVANLLVGNEVNHATLEITLLGPIIEFQQDTLISICGANLSPTIFGNPIHNNRPILVKAGSILRFGSAKQGCRAYLAIAGGIQVDPIMKSKSTYLRAGIGGHQGRALRKGDQLLIGSKTVDNNKLETELARFSHRLTDYEEAKWSFDPLLFDQNNSTNRIRAIKGRQYDWFSQESQQAFVNKTFKILADSDRMGYRLKGEIIKRNNTSELISEAVTMGTIQVPSDGNPIVLLADGQTTGGYPKIGEVISIDIPLLSQAKPGDKVKFEWITLAKAQKLYMEREQLMNQLEIGIALHLRRCR
ncbi:biotin-dependent carboxyltransferase family protein [Paraliobacillus zengyii]|uniref:5-oxoprolinase subunit C family protein n=1 Tax=Paraliobacillus zengyii TaxID=2213194 RepID=UPI000DD3A79C|nr:biotin-dependent carboxyltransferase family protein [Paraliobacillus zengyii]